jgi:transcriptional regulator with XRE-family HTH domain
MNTETPTGGRTDRLKSVIAANISDLRRKNGMTQLDLAEKLNYTDKAISKWERGESLPDVLVLKSIADLFGVTVDYLLEEEHPIPAADHAEDEDAARKQQSIRTRGFVTGMSILLVWLVATVLFMIADMASVDMVDQWLVFMYAVPASMVLWLVLNSVWFDRRRNYLIISLLMWSILATVYATVWRVADYNAWIIFMLGLPGQAIILMWSRLKQKGDPFQK